MPQQEKRKSKKYFTERYIYVYTYVCMYNVQITTYTGIYIKLKYFSSPVCKSIFY